MRQTFITVLFFVFASCKAQTILDISQRVYPDFVPGAYYKDTHNLLDPFIGTYVYTNGTTSFKIVLQKKVSVVPGEYSEDLIIGEYQYIENGVEKANTLAKLNINNPYKILHSIKANTIITGTQLGCGGCGPNEKRLLSILKDGPSDNIADIQIRKMLNSSGQEVIRVTIVWMITVHIQPFVDASFPGGQYELIKQ